MLDREKVIRAMECCAVGAECDHCPYTLMNKSGHEGCYQMHTDALALLKAQEPVKPITSEEQYGDHLRHCPSCGKALPNSGEYGKSNYCYKCGQAVKYDD